MVRYICTDIKFNKRVHIFIGFLPRLNVTSVHGLSEVSVVNLVHDG